MPTKKKQTDPTDRHIGARIRMRRMQVGMSQTTLGEQCGGITFQQVQKYEKGANRVGGSRLAQLAKALKVAPGWFYDGLPGHGDIAQALETTAFDNFMSLPHAVSVVCDFERMSNQQRGVVADICRQFASANAKAKPGLAAA